MNLATNYACIIFGLFAAKVVHPWITTRTLCLTRSPLTDITLMLQTALLSETTATLARPVIEVTVEHVTVGDSIGRLGILHPLDEFLTGDKVNVRQSQDRVDEVEETLLAMGSVKEPG